MGDNQFNMQVKPLVLYFFIFKHCIYILLLKFCVCFMFMLQGGSVYTYCSGSMLYCFICNLFDQYFVNFFSCTDIAIQTLFFHFSYVQFLLPVNYGIQMYPYIVFFPTITRLHEALIKVNPHTYLPRHM